jgi:hypothetical protein
MLVRMLAAGVRARGELCPSAALTWLIVFEFAAALAVIAAMYLRMRTKNRLMRGRT